jgi:DNA-binding beta-propeller fold protein YncE
MLNTLITIPAVKKIKSGLVLCSLFTVLCFLLSVSGLLNAQQFLNYVDSITQDEEGNKLFLPSFVLAEPVMNEIYVIDGRARIIIYTADLFPLFTINKKKGIEAPQGLAVDADGTLYIAQSATEKNPRHRISVLDASLKWVRDIYLEGFEGSDSFSPHRLAVDKKGYLYVASTSYPGILILDDKGNLVDILSPDENGGKVRLNDVTIDKTGKIYLVSEEEGHIYVYDENKKFLFKFGDKGGSSGKLSRPKAAGVDNRNGTIYVIDYMRHTLNAYDKDGKYIFEFGGMGWGQGWFQFPTDLSVDTAGRILVADLFNHRVQILSPEQQQPAPERPAGEETGEKEPE